MKILFMQSNAFSPTLTSAHHYSYLIYYVDEN